MIVVKRRKVDFIKLRSPDQKSFPAFCLLPSAYCLLLTAHRSLTDVLMQKLQLIALLTQLHSQQIAN
jgi:hypothetical protein